MSVESPITPENPRTGISFWPDKERTYLAQADLAKIYHLLVVQPSSLVIMTHELWRIGKEEIVFTILRDNKDLVLSTTLKEGGGLVNAITTLEQKKESFDNCFQFSKDFFYLIEKAATNQEFNSLIEPEKLKELDLKAEKLMHVS